jgi:hypothetical protein
MRRLVVLALIGAMGCNADWRAQAMNDAEAMVRAQVSDRPLQFSQVQFTGDHQSGKLAVIS